MNDKSLAAIKDHIHAGEKAIPFPYLDNKGNVTIAIGHKIENFEQFEKLDINVGKPGRGVIPATPEDKRQAWDALQGEIEKGGFEKRPASDYQTVTATRMAPDAVEADFDRLVREDHLPKAKAALKDDAAWDRLTDAQKAILGGCTVR